MRITIKHIVLTSMLVLLIDFTWIKLAMKSEYDKLIFDVQNKEMNVRPVSVLLAYVAIITPIILFSLPNIRPEHRLVDSITHGGVLGMMIYGMFSFTNHALIQGWSSRVAIMDTVWGFVLYTIVTYLVSLST